MSLDPINVKQRLFTRLVREATACSLCPRLAARTAVLSPRNGLLTPKVLFIGEAPGRRGADRTRIPFHGDIAGRNFERFIAAIGLTRAEIFVTNAVLCNPRTADDCQNAKPTRSEIQNCSAFLRRLIDLLDPPIVATLGGTALAAVRLIERHDLILREAVGCPHAWYERRLVPLYHPAQRVLNTQRSFTAQLRDYGTIRRLLAER